MSLTGVDENSQLMLRCVRDLNAEEANMSYSEIQKRLTFPSPVP